MTINGYELKVVCANAFFFHEAENPEDNVYTFGDIYNRYEDVVEEHPEEKILYGFCLEGTTESPDWFNTVEEAVHWALEH